jgi:hypothetical protein
MIRCVDRQCALEKRKKNMRLAVALCLFMRTLPINFSLLGGNGNTLKYIKYINIKYIKLKAKRTSIAMIRYLCQTYATFVTVPTLLGSHYRLPLSSFYDSCCSNIEQVALLYVPITVQYVYLIVTAGNERGAFFPALQF